MERSLRAIAPVLAVAVVFALPSRPAAASEPVVGNADEGWVVYDEASRAFQAKLRESENIRYLKNDVLEVAAKLPKGAVLSIPKDVAASNYNYRAADGSVKWSSNLFHGNVTILSVEPGDQAQFPAQKLAQLNAIEGGLYISSTVVEDYQQSSIPPVHPSEPKEGYLQHYSAEGKPKFSATSAFKQRFGSQLNRAIDPGSQSGAERAKWSAILAELRNAVDRTVAGKGELLFIDKSLAKQQSILFEQKGTVQAEGAWTIAMATAERHGWPDTPCAEFVSEVIRQSYRRAGYDHRVDFKEIPLYYSPTALVKSLADALHKAGWIPWEAAKYKPVTGAPMMHYKATSPGHTYLVAGDDGRIIVDNGSPRGRDLRAANGNTTAGMHIHGVFFLPPGVIPDSWP